jgi:hypothetical protein
MKLIIYAKILPDCAMPNLFNNWMNRKWVAMFENGLRGMYYPMFISLNRRNITVDSPPVEMVKSPFHLIDGIAVERKNQ